MLVFRILQSLMPLHDIDEALDDVILVETAAPAVFTLNLTSFSPTKIVDPWGGQNNLVNFVQFDGLRYLDSIC